MSITRARRTKKTLKRRLMRRRKRPTKPRKSYAIDQFKSLMEVYLRICEELLFREGQEPHQIQSFYHAVYLKTTVQRPATTDHALSLLQEVFNSLSLCSRIEFHKDDDTGGPTIDVSFIGDPPLASASGDRTR